MKIKIKRKIKPEFGYYPYNKYLCSKAGFKFVCNLYEDESGYFKAFKRNVGFKCEESGGIEKWIDDLQDEVDDLNLLLDFLKEVNYYRKQPENSLKEN
jgi:hypothetical protein